MASPLLSKSPRKQGYGTLHDVTLEENAAINKTGPATASFLSRMLFSYANPMMEMGNKRQLNNEDLWGLDGENKTSEAYAKYKVNFDRCNGSVTRAMIYTYGGPFVLCGCATLFSMACSVLAPAVLHHVIDAFTAPVVDVGTWLSGWVRSLSRSWPTRLLRVKWISTWS